MFLWLFISEDFNYEIYSYISTIKCDILKTKGKLKIMTANNVENSTP